MDSLEYFEKYEQGQLSKQEAEEFQAKLASDSEFKEEYEEYLSMQSFLEAKSDIDDQKKHLKKLRTQYEEKAEKPRKRRLIYVAMAVAATAAVLLFVILDRPGEMNGPEIYAAYFSPANIDLNTKGSAAEINASLKTAIQDYNTGNYEAAFPNLDTAGVQPQLHANVLLAKGIAGINGSQSLQGRDILRQLAAGNASFRNDAYWYLALSFLKEEKYEEVTEALNSISTDSNYGKRKAEILEYISKIVKG